MAKNLFELANADVTPGFDTEARKMVESKKGLASIRGGKIVKKWSIQPTYARSGMINDAPADTDEEYDNIVVDSSADWKYNDTANNIKDALSDLKGY